MNPEELIDHVKACVALGDAEKSKLPISLLAKNLDGLSSNKVRHFLNNLCNISDWKHLEIGTHTGSTLIAAGYKNPLKFLVAIDDFSMRPNRKHEVFNYLQKYKEDLPSIHFIMENCWKFNNKGLGKFNTYFYDACHTRESQEQAIIQYWKNLENLAVIIIDDFDVKNVKRGTWNGFDYLRVKKQIIEHWHLRGGNEKTRHDLWWGGLGVFVINKGDYHES